MRSVLFVTERLRSRNASCRHLQALHAPEAQQTPALRAAQHAALYLRAQRSRHGKQLLAWLGRRPEHSAVMSPPITYVDGGSMRPLPAMNARSRRTSFICHPRPERCCCRRLARTPHVPSTCCLRTRRSSSPVHSCCVGCDCPSRWRPGIADRRAACATAGVLPARAIPLERICCEAGTRIAQNVLAWCAARRRCHHSQPCWQDRRATGWC